MVLAQLLHAFDFRSETSTVFSPNSLRNRWLVAALLGSMALHLLVVYVPALQRVFSTRALSVADWGWVLVSALLPVLLIDIAKVVAARRRPAV
jgi:Ca2+-transporting ATPase